MASRSGSCSPTVATVADGQDVGVDVDSQQVEILGRNLLVADLLRAGIEVARPERDRGIDLVAYVDDDLEHGRFRAVPIQMKASTGSTFSITRKYERFPTLIMAYVWQVTDPSATTIIAITFREALVIAADAGWLQTKSWTDRGHYVSNRPSKAIRKALEPYEVTPERWRGLVAGGE